MLRLIRNATVLAPEPVGVRDVLIAGEGIAALAEPGSIALAGVELDEIDGAGLFLLPGLVDCHVHLLGGGGEGGPATRAPEIRVEEIVASGVTTVIGCLGTDGVTRHMSSLLAKAGALEREGISAFAMVGSYEVPVQTVTGSVRSDLALLPSVVGVGEVAVSDHRSSQPSFDELARLAADCRVGALLGGKAGILHLHLGDGSRGLELVFRIVGETEIPASQIVPTHCNRKPELLDEAFRFVGIGGRIDLTAGLGEHGPALPAVEAVRRAVVNDVPLASISISSDANGSLPVFDEHGALTHLGVASQQSLLETLRAIVNDGVLPLDQAAALLTSNPARFFGLEGKGRIAVGADADLMLLDDRLELVHLFARGRPAVLDGRVVLRGTFSAAE